MLTLFKSFFDELDKELLSIDRVHVERKLMGFYSEFWELLKDMSGNSSGFSGFSEFLFLRYLIIDLQKQLGLCFKTEELTKDTRKFVAGDLVILHGCDISKELPYFPSLFPDLLVMQSLENNEKKLLAALEIKIYFSNRQALLGDLERLRTINEKQPDANVYMISFSDQYLHELKEFHLEKPDRYGVIMRTEESQFSVPFEKVIDDIIVKVKINRQRVMQKMLSKTYPVEPR